MTNQAGSAAFDIARRALVGPAGLAIGLLLNAQWSGDGPGWLLFGFAGVGFGIAGTLAGLVLPVERPGVAAAVTAASTVAGLVAAGQAFLAWNIGTGEPLTQMVFLLSMAAFTIVVPLTAAIAFALVPGRPRGLVWRATGSFLLGAIAADLVVGVMGTIGTALTVSGETVAQSLDAFRRAQALGRGLLVLAVGAGAWAAVVAGATGVASALATGRPRMERRPEAP